MKTITIAFDIDGTLRNNQDHYDHGEIGSPKANERIRSLLVILASFKNVKIWVWSGGGEFYARQICQRFGLDPYVDRYLGKNLVGKTDDGRFVFDPDDTPDIAIDDIHDCELGSINLIVKEK